MRQIASLFGLEVALLRFFQANYPAELEQLRQAGVWGRTAVETEKGPWDNIAVHCMIVAIICYVLGLLVGLPKSSLDQLVRVALLHDMDKRANREAIWAAYGDDAKNTLTRQFEESKSGLEGVTSINMLGFMLWPIEFMILRLADSYAGQIEKLQGITSWRVRILQLIERDRTGEHGHKGHSQDIGDRLYGGRPFYEVLFMVSEHCEILIFNAIMRHRSDIAIGGWTVDQMQKLLEQTISSTLSKFTD
jgi:hypothetical protein